jgi:hypothetical protein
MILLYHYGGTIVNNLNSIIAYKGGNNVILSSSLDMLPTKLKHVMKELSGIITMLKLILLGGCLLGNVHFIILLCRFLVT